MRIRSVRVGDIIKDKRERERDEFSENEWKVVQVCKNMVLTRSVKVPQVRRCFSYGDLIAMQLEWQGFDHVAAEEEMKHENFVVGMADYKRALRK